MSLSETELQLHCQAIIDLSQRKHGIIILCEGNINEIKGRVEQYRRLETFPDANFYKACIPTWWQGKRPTFVPCGDRKDVIDTYFKLCDLGFDRTKIFAIIDLDLQPYPFENYVVSDTEALFSLYYQKGKLQSIDAQKIGIFITGFIYKEAYFLIPDLQAVFDDYPIPLLFNDVPLNLLKLYQTMATALSTDNNLNANFQRACDRINYLATLDFSSLTALQNSWLQTFSTANELEKRQLIYALLTIHQVKQYWKAFKPSDNAIPLPRFEEQLTLAIGQFYARQPRASDHHLPSFFNILSINA